MSDFLRTLIDQLKQILGPDPNETLKISLTVLAMLGGVASIMTGAFQRTWQLARQLIRSSVGLSPESAAEQQVKAVADVAIHAIVSLQELQTVWNFDEEAYGDDENITFDLFRQWWAAYPEGLVAAYKNGKPVAVIGILPVTREWSEKLVRREVTERQLDAEVIQQSRRRHWYVSGISVAKRRKGLSRLVGKLICQAVQLWYETNRDLLRRGTISVVSVGTTPEGRDLLQESLRFRLINAGDEAKKQHPIFAREIGEQDLFLFLTQSEKCKGCCDPILLAQMQSSQQISSDLRRVGTS